MRRRPLAYFACCAFFVPPASRSFAVGRSAFGRKASAAPASAAGDGRQRSLSSRYKERLRPRVQDDAWKKSFIDTHCHLDKILPLLSKQSHTDAKKAAARGETPPRRLNADFEEWRESLDGPEREFEGCVNIGCSSDSLDICASFLKHEKVFGAFGIHPLRAQQWNEEVEEKIRSMMSLDKVVAWGECGLDYFDKQTRGQMKDMDARNLQREVFARQIELAVACDKPLVVHTRFAEEDTLELLGKHLPEYHPVHVHCFTSSLNLATALLERFPSLRIGFTGVITFKNAPEVQEVVRNVPLDRILLETDGPYMAPEPFRGRIAHPGHVAYVADAIARLKGVPREEVLQTCRENTRRTYGI
mmetsp:Transcript_38143/g.85310  ORF Transcript_38143/g.85310 Transcript_38143/m.85310 type:complete len:359 (+) Transcript_38143:41-1117(+)